MPDTTTTPLQDLDTLYGRRQGCGDPECSVCRDNERILTRLATLLAGKCDECGTERICPNCELT